MSLRHVWIAAALAAAPPVAFAQDDAAEEDPTAPQTEPDPEATEEGMGGPVDDPTADEPPGEEAPDFNVFGGGAKKTVVRYTKETFPLAWVARPLTLPADMIELSLDVPAAVLADAPYLTQILRGAFGVTRDLQIGLTYGFGLQVIDPAEYEAGKAFSVDAAYTIFPQRLAIAASVPFYVDPFASGISLGAPFQLRIGDRWQVSGGQDLLQFRFAKFPPNPADPAYNVGQVEAQVVGAREPIGNLNLKLRGAYQARTNLVVFLDWGFHWLDFEGDDKPVSMFLGGLWSSSNRMDVGGRIGLSRVDEGDSLTVGLFAAYRL